MNGAHHRRDPLTGARVVVAPARRRRRVDAELSGPPDGDCDPGPCPFCPGAEAHLAPIVHEIPGAHGSGWAARAVENLYPAYTTAGESEGDGGRPPARGRQEVLVETPRHDGDLWNLTPDEARIWVDLYLGRMAAAYERPGRTVFAFRNRGRDAGASRAHPHGQLWAVEGPVPAQRRRVEMMRRAHDDGGSCLVCDPSAPDDGGARTVVDDGTLRVEVPWAALAPWHMRVVPVRHLTTWTRADEGLRTALARLLPRLAGALRVVGGDPAWNLTFHDFGTVPDEALHAHLEILPRLSRTAGFELASGLHINEGEPAADAAALRTALTSDFDRES